MWSNRVQGSGATIPAMSDWDSLFDCAVAFDPAMDLEESARPVPGRWVVYLLADAENRPVQLLCVKNLRASLKRRLAGEEMVGPSRKVNYRDLVRHIHWRRVDSDLEADWVYLEAARAIFPGSYRGMVGFRPAWFVHVDPEAAFPRYIKTSDLGRTNGIYIGPLEDKHAAARLIELVEDSFDLCRYYNILLEAPRGRACAYKEMGKCPAPCDGSISMDQYRHMIEWSARTIVDPADFVRDQEERMRSAAGELRFESAAKIRAFIGQASQFGQGPFRHARRLEDFRYLSIQRGPYSGTAKVFIITPGTIANPINLTGPPQRVGELLGMIRTAAQSGGRGLEGVEGVDAVGAERIAVVSHHLFVPKGQGAFIAAAAMDESALARAYRQVQKQKETVPTEGEGVVKELTAM